MTDLQEKLSRATEPSRELDKEIWQLLVPGVTRRTIHVDHHVKPYDIDETRDASGKLIIVPHYTASLDAALALVAEVLPGQWRQTTYDPGKIKPYFGKISISRPYGCYENYHGNHKSSEPIALLIALLKATNAGADNDQ